LILFTTVRYQRTNVKLRVLRQGVGIPATHHLFAQWLPPLERSRLMGYSYAGHLKSLIVSNNQIQLSFSNSQ